MLHDTTTVSRISLDVSIRYFEIGVSKRTRSVSIDTVLEGSMISSPYCTSSAPASDCTLCTGFRSGHTSPVAHPPSTPLALAPVDPSSWKKTEDDTGKRAEPTVRSGSNRSQARESEMRISPGESGGGGGGCVKVYTSPR